MMRRPLRWLGDSPWVPGTHLYPLVPPLPVLDEITLGPPPFRGSRILPIAEEDRYLETSVERKGDALESWVRLPGLAVRAQGLHVREDVVGDHDRARLELRARLGEECLVLLFLGVEEDDVEHVVDALERLERVALHELGPVRESGLVDVGAPGLDLRRVVLEREHATTQVADAGGEPDRGVAAGTTDLEHFAVGLRRDVREQELSRGAGDLARTLLTRHVPGALVRVLCLETGEHGANAVVEHFRAARSRPGLRRRGRL